MNKNQLILVIAFLLINFLGKAQVTEPTIIANAWTTCEGSSNYEIPINTSRELLPMETITWSSNGLGDHLEVASDKMRATLLSTALPGNYRIEVRIDNAENNEFAIDFVEIDIIAEPEVNLINPVEEKKVYTSLSSYDVEVSGISEDYNVFWQITENYNGTSLPQFSNIYSTYTTINGIDYGSWYEVAVTVSDNNRVCPDAVAYFEISNAGRTHAIVGGHHSCSSSYPTKLVGAVPIFIDAPQNEKAEWIDIDGVKGSPGAVYYGSELLF